MLQCCVIGGPSGIKVSGRTVETHTPSVKRILLNVFWCRCERRRRMKTIKFVWCPASGESHRRLLLILFFKQRSFQQLPFCHVTRRLSGLERNLEMEAQRTFKRSVRLSCLCWEESWMELQVISLLRNQCGIKSLLLHRCS